MLSFSRAKLFWQATYEYTLRNQRKRHKNYNTNLMK